MTTLKQLVDETTNIKNDIVTCHSRLRTNLSNKNVSSLQTDKLPVLIDKVNLIDTVDTLQAGNNNILTAFGFKYSGGESDTYPSTTVQIYIGGTDTRWDVAKIHSCFKGSIRIFSRCKLSGTDTSNADLTFELYDSNRELKTSKTIKLVGGVFSTTNFDFGNIEKNDYIKITTMNTRGRNNTLYVYAVDFKYL